MQAHDVDKKMPVSSNPNLHMHMQLSPPLLQQVPSDQTMTVVTAQMQNAPASGQTF